MAKRKESSSAPFKPKKYSKKETKELEKYAIILQKRWRIYNGIRKIRALVREVFDKVYDEGSGTYFYYNKHTGESSWIKPKCLGSEEFDDYEIGDEWEENIDGYGTSGATKAAKNLPMMENKC